MVSGVPAGRCETCGPAKLGQSGGGLLNSLALNDEDGLRDCGGSGHRWPFQTAKSPLEAGGDLDNKES